MLPIKIWNLFLQLHIFDFKIKCKAFVDANTFSIAKNAESKLLIGQSDKTKLHSFA